MKRILSILTILLVLCLPVTSFAICGPAPTPGGDWVFPGGFCDNILLVCPTSEYETIGAAMNAADAGDTILVAEGTYNEAVIFPHDDITLRAQGSAENTIITQPNGTAVNFDISSGCTVDGFTISLSASNNTNDETIYSNNDSATDYNTVKNCIITDVNAGGSTFALTMINIDDGGFKLLNNTMHITQSNDSACYAMQNTAANISHYRDNNLTITQGTTGAHGSFGLHHNAGAGSTMYCMNNIIDFDAAHLTAGVAYILYASAKENYVSGNEINAVTTGSGALYVLFTGGTDTAWYTGNQIYATTGDGDAEWANLTAGTTYATGNNISGDGASTTGGTVYESGNAINGVLSGGVVAGTIIETDLDADSAPADGDILTYDSTGTNFDWITPSAETDITTDLEEETHASEHTIGGADVIDRLFEGADPTAITIGDANPPVASKGLYDCVGSTTITITDFFDSGDDDHSEFADGNYFGIYMNDADVTIDFSGNTKIEGNAGTDFTGSASDIVLLIFVFVDETSNDVSTDHWVCINYNMGFSDPTTFASKLVIHQAQDNNGDTMTTAEAYNFVWFATGAGTITLLAVVDGMNFCVENHTAGDVLIAPNGTDAIKLNGGTQMTDGWSIIGTDIGDGCCFKFFEAGAWSAWCNGYEDNGS